MPEREIVQWSSNDATGIGMVRGKWWDHLSSGFIRRSFPSFSLFRGANTWFNILLVPVWICLHPHLGISSPDRRSPGSTRWRVNLPSVIFYSQQYRSFGELLLHRTLISLATMLWATRPPWWRVSACTLANTPHESCPLYKAWHR